MWRNLFRKLDCYVRRDHHRWKEINRYSKKINSHYQQIEDDVTILKECRRRGNQIANSGLDLHQYLSVDLPAFCEKARKYCSYETELLEGIIEEARKEVYPILVVDNEK